jgi:hypothetical protein
MREARSSSARSQSRRDHDHRDGRRTAAGRSVDRHQFRVVFQSFNRYLGVAVGEHLGYLITGTWTWVGVLGIVIGPVLMLCSLEFVGRHEPAGWKLAEPDPHQLHRLVAAAHRHRHRTARLTTGT